MSYKEMVQEFIERDIWANIKTVIYLIPLINIILFWDEGFVFITNLLLLVWIPRVIILIIVVSILELTMKRWLRGVLG